ncbi:MAG TPA: hypothetical protein VJ691_02720 [Vicinamibacterales bacterium]|nr:hypothetical protein [Vicinamibacterales bacterium]
MRTRAATIACQVAVIMLLTSGVGAQSDSPRVVKITSEASQLLTNWFGPLPRPVQVTRSPRWLTPVRDQSQERAVIGDMARQYWAASSPASPAFVESIVIYVAARAIHHLLEIDNFAAPRFFGGVVPFPLRSVRLSLPVSDPRPRVIEFEELENPGAPDHLQGIRALQTLERYVGWPAMLDAMARLRRTDSSKWDAMAFAAILSDVRGIDMRFLVTECFRSDAVFDYALADLQTRVLPDGQFESTVSTTRTGSGRFSLEEEGAEPEVPVVVRFADGREVRDAIDGAAPSATLIYTAPDAAVSAAVDPDVMLVLDIDRGNNARFLEPRFSKLSVRLAFHWLAWLQNAMLSYTALV